jgi:hypothetical protein
MPLSSGRHLAVHDFGESGRWEQPGRARLQADAAGRTVAGTRVSEESPGSGGRAAR